MSRREFSRELWAVLEPLVDQALDLDPDARGRLVEQVRVRNPEIAAELESLLASEAVPLDAALDGQRAAALQGQGLAGQVVGSYTLDRSIGQGGMATVWLAHRTDGRYEGQVAVKLLNLALMGRSGEERFAQEGTVLARLAHPRIARLLDAGITAAGQPFLVLEHVVGRRIDRYADENRCSPADRIALCIAVLDALASAHAKLIVHRDIKPSNILVSDDGGVKLLDFGIATLLLEGRPTADPTTLTDHGGRALTPEYAAPELLRGEPVSAATDVYSTGVLLYVLLSGRHPTAADARTPADRIRALLDEEPARLSEAVIKGSPDDVAARAAARGSTPEKLQRLYRGDLDNIVAKALHRQPADRYPSAAAFADDLQRFLSHEPVSARADAWGYRARKFIRRHRAAVVTGALVVLALLAATVFSTRQMLVAQRERDRAADALRRSRATTRFETLLFQLIEPGAPPLTYRQLLDKGRLVLDREFRGDPISRMQLRFQFAQNYLRDGDGAAADSVVRVAIGIADSLADPEWQGRSRCELAVVLGQRQEVDSARALVRAARVHLARARGVERGAWNACDRGEADALLTSGKADSAAPLYRAVVDRFAADGDTAESQYLIALSDLSNSLYQSRRLRDAREIQLRILAAAHGGQLAEPREYGVMVANTAIVYEVLGEFTDQQAFLRREVPRLTALDSTRIDGLVAFTYGFGLSHLDQPDSAALWLERAIAAMGDRDPMRVYAAHLTLARLARQAGRPADVARHERAAAPLATRAGSGMMARGIAAAHRIEGGADVGGELAALGYTPDATARGFTTPVAAAARALVRANRFDEAVAYAEHVARLGRLDSLADVRSAYVGHGLLLTAQAESGRGNRSRARELADSAVAPLTFALGARHPLTRDAVALRDSLDP